MFQSLRRPLICVLVVAVLVSLPSASLANHSWGNYHWARTANPFTLKLGDNVTSTWDSHLATTSSDWSASQVLDTTIVPGSAKGKNCRPPSGRVEVCNAAYGNNGWLGIAQIWVSGSHITQGSTRVNDTYFNTPTYNTSAWRNLVMCQEVGHTLGLDHQDENFNNANLGTCMDYTNNPGTNQHPNQHDYDQLETIYAHLDSTTTVGQSVGTGNGNAYGRPPAMDDLELDGPGQWGRLVSRSRNGKAETYELDFGRGHKIFTFVIWVLEE